MFTLLWLTAPSTKLPLRPAHAAEDSGGALSGLPAASTLSTEGHSVLDGSSAASSLGSQPYFPSHFPQYFTGAFAILVYISLAATLLLPAMAILDCKRGQLW